MSDASLTIVRRLKAPHERVFEALIRPELLARWMGPDDGPVLICESDPRVGGAFRVRFRMLNGEEHEASGIYREVEGPRRLALTWQWADEPGRQSLVEIDLGSRQDGTELTFTHSRLPDRQARDSHRIGWNGALDKLEALLDRNPAV